MTFKGDDMPWGGDVNLNGGQCDECGTVEECSEVDGRGLICEECECSSPCCGAGISESGLCLGCKEHV